MPVDCPICAKPVSDDRTSCPVCGFPTALAPDAAHIRDEPEPPAPRTDRSAPRAVASARGTGGPGANPQADLTHRLAVEIRSGLAVVQELGADSAEIQSELRQAALTQADGRTSEAVGLLRGALARVQKRTEDTCARRLDELAERQAALVDDGVGADFGSEFAVVRARLAANDRKGAAEALRDVEGKIVRVETDWKGLHALITQIEQLRTAARAAGRTIPEVESDLAQVRTVLAESPLKLEVLDTAAQTASRALMLLHESLPPLLEAELSEHAKTLTGFPADHPPARRARALHGDTSRHLRRGRLAEATTSLRELREAIQALKELPPEPPAAPPPPVAPVAVAAPPPRVPSVAPSPAVADPEPEPTPVREVPAVTLERLLRQARDLAARVRALPHESEVAFEAAAEIRRATEFLRARKLDEAERTLTRLMLTLSAEPVVEA
ncbi:MAG TPA: hypothetical protein VFF67_09640 [Thermoplasmata archaeon]|nr:hypothetical protein [Thermoplasmata archaeon]